MLKYSFKDFTIVGGYSSVSYEVESLIYGYINNLLPDNNKPNIQQAMPRHAPNIYVNYEKNIGEDQYYDILSVDWKCDVSGEQSYWAVHHWTGGYAGYQYVDGRHVILMSLWDLPDGRKPTIEYALGGKHGDFGGEGTGKQVFTEYPWQVGKWYTMRIQIDYNYDENKTYFEQWVREEEGPWLKTAVISYPTIFENVRGTSFFMEDFLSNNVERSCYLKNAYVRTAQTGQWDCLDTYHITNTYFPFYGADWGDEIWNIQANNYHESDGDSAFLSCGGRGFQPVQIQNPATYKIKSKPLPEDDFWLE